MIPIIHFLNWKQRTAVKSHEDAKNQNACMYVEGVSAKTASRYSKNVEEQVIRIQSRVWSNV